MLTLKQQKFIDAYLGVSNGNATRAAAKAGYASPHPEGARMLQNATVSAEIARRLQENSMSANEVIARLTDAGRGIGAYLEIRDSKTYVDMESLLADGKGHLVKGIKETEFGQVVEFVDSQSALVNLGRYHKLFTDKTEHSFANLTDEQFLAECDRRLAAQAQPVRAEDRESESAIPE